jgi:hypothetical protein
MQALPTIVGIAAVVAWLLSGSLALNNLLAIALAALIVSNIRLPSLKASGLGGRGAAGRRGLPCTAPSGPAAPGRLPGDAPAWATPPRPPTCACPLAYAAAAATACAVTARVAHTLPAADPHAHPRRASHSPVAPPDCRRSPPAC